jgi:hypothetical protein
MKRIPKLLGTTLVAVCVTSIAACSGNKTCTLIGCGQALELNLSQELPPGAYTVDITTNGKTSRCDFVLGEDPEVSCDEVQATLTSDKLYVYPALSQLEVEMKDVDGNVLAAQSYVPDYEESYPNGEGCSVCLNASDTLVVSQ